MTGFFVYVCNTSYFLEKCRILLRRDGCQGARAPALWAFKEGQKRGYRILSRQPPNGQWLRTLARVAFLKGSYRYQSIRCLVGITSQVTVLPEIDDVLGARIFAG